MTDFEFVFDDHDEFEYGECFQDQNSKSNVRYLLLSKSFSLLFLILLRKMGILSGWNLRIIYAYWRRSFVASIDTTINTIINMQFLITFWLCTIGPPPHYYILG